VLGRRRRPRLASPRRPGAHRRAGPAVTRNTRRLLVRGTSRVHFPPLLQWAPTVSLVEQQLTTGLSRCRPKPSCSGRYGTVPRQSGSPTEYSSFPRRGERSS
jgi:hypothetical protein